MIKLIYRVVVAVVTVALLVSGCATKPDTSESIPTRTIAEHEALLTDFKPWRALGSIAIDSAAQGKFNASFAWEVKNQGFDIKLFGPLGVQVVQLSETKDGAQITDREGTLDGDNARVLLQAVLGSDVPIDEMQAWAVGLPGDATELKRDAIGRLENISVEDNEQAFWKVDFKRYTVFENKYLPKSVLVEGEGVTINLSFKKWSRGEVVDNGRLSIPGVGS